VLSQFSQKTVHLLCFGRFEQFAHHFNENCLTISIFIQKSKSDHCSSIVLKVQNQNLLLFDKFLSHFNDSRPILTRILTVLNMFSKSESDFCSLNSGDFSVHKNCHWRLCFECFFVKSSTIPSVLAVLCYEHHPWGVEWRFSSFTLSEWWPGLCSIAGDPPFNKIFIGAAYFSHRVKRGKIGTKTR
jgi:hypothetical protein